MLDPAAIAGLAGIALAGCAVVFGGCALGLLHRAFQRAWVVVAGRGRTNRRKVQIGSACIKVAFVGAALIIAEAIARAVVCISQWSGLLG